MMSRKLVKTVNSLGLSEFFETYLPQESLEALNVQDATRERLGLQVLLTGTLGGALTPLTMNSLEQCLRLIEATSADDYRNSEIKWSLSKKRKEMHLPDMRYVILYGDSDKPTLAGFVSFMITYEDGHEVVYCYEIHLTEKWQRRGLGKKLMTVVEEVGRRVGVEKSMLTVFKSNEQAVKMYQSLGYDEDEFSPATRKLRNGTVKEASYVILSKDLRSVK